MIAYAASLINCLSPCKFTSVKKLFLLIFLIPVFFACKKDEAIISDSTELQQQPDWTAEKFKSEYTIQFPGYYAGGYIQGFEGGWFDKVRDDSRVAMSYMFSNGLQTFDFGDTLADENATGIMLQQGDLLWNLNERLDFTSNGAIAGILFYRTMDGTHPAELYWKDNGLFRDALTIQYDSELQDEVISIIRTIQHN